MRTNTLVTYPMTAQYREWIPRTTLSTGLTYRQYSDAKPVRCNIVVTTIGAISLFSSESLQPFAIVQDMKDASGTGVMDEVWYSVQKVTPIFDAFGNVSSYRHQLAMLAAELLSEPINPPAEYPDLDQVS